MGDFLLALFFWAHMGPNYVTRLSLDTNVGYDKVQPGKTSDRKRSGFDNAVETLH